MSTTFQQTCIDYLTELRNLHSSTLATNELSLRPALDKFIRRTSETFGLSVLFVGEPKKIEAGRPDFTAISNDMPIGYIEAETCCEERSNQDLDNLTGHAKEQNERFRMNLDNFLLTNYIEFRLYVGGELADSAKLSAPPDKGAVKIFYEDADALEMLFERFLSGELPPISLPRDLATHLARRTRQMRNEVLEALEDQMPEDGDLYGAYQAFKDVLLPDLNAAQFADMYAQTIAYGLFAARCVAPQGKYFSRQSAADLVPKTNPFLRRLFQRIAAHDLDQGIAWIADDIARLLAQTPIEEILAN